MNLMKGIGLALLSASLFACSSHQVNVDISSTANLNFNQYNEALPVVMRVYQLTDAQQFSSATFEELWKKDAVTLGSTMLTKEEVTIQPSSKSNVTFEKHDSARYVGLFAMFRNRDDQKWKVIKGLSDSYFSFSTELNVLVTSNTVELAGEKSQTEPKNSDNSKTKENEKK